MAHDKAVQFDVASLLKAAQTTPHHYATEVAEAVMHVLGVAQVVVGISDQEGDVFRLKATAGFGARGDSLPVEVSRHITIDNIHLGPEDPYGEGSVPSTVAELFDDRSWETRCIYSYIEAPQLRRIDRVGLRAPYLFVAVSVPSLEESADALAPVRDAAPFLGRLYLAALNEQKLAIRVQVVDQANQSKDAGSLVHRVCQLAKKAFHLESVAAFLPDDSRRALDLRAVFPRPGGSDKLGSYRLILETDTASPIVRSFSSSIIEIFDLSDLSRPLVDLFPTVCPQVLTLPLCSADSPMNTNAEGLILCVGKSWTSGREQHCGTFLWEDLALLEFLGDMLTILVRMLRGKDEASFRVERTLHGAKWMLSNIQANLSLLVDNGVDKSVPPPLIYALPNALALLDDIAAQLERKRLGSLEKIPLEDDIFLFGDVLASMASFAPALSRALGRNAMKVNHLKESTIAGLPQVRSNTSALVTVFRNLVHNAVKYSRRDKGFHPWLTFEGSATPDTVTITVSDNGLGVPLDERELVFQEGYRSQVAMDVDPTGLGVGLSDCREIMTLLGGRIWIGDPAKVPFGQASTSVSVTIPIRPSSSSSRATR